MSEVRIKILEKDVRSLKYQYDELEQMLEMAKSTLCDAYMENDASLKAEDAQQMVEDSY